MLRKGATYAGASMVQMVATATAVPFLTRLLAPQEFGSAVTGLIIIQVTWILASWGIPAAVTRQYLREESGASQARRLIGASILTAVITSGLLLASSGLWGRLFGFSALEKGLVLSVAAGGVLALVNSCQAYQRAQGSAGAFALSVALSAGLGNALGVGLCFLSTEPTHSTFLMGMLGGSLAAVVWGVVKAQPRRLARTDWSAIVWVALPTLPHMLGIYLISSVDRIVVSSTLGTSAVGHYQVAYFLGSSTLLGLQAINNAWAPTIIGAPDSSRSALLYRTTRQLSWLAAAGVAGTAAAAPWGLALMAPGSYQSDELVVVTALIALCPLPAVVYLAHSHVLFVHGQMRAFTYSSPIALLVGVAVAATLSRPWGLIGVALAPVAAQVTLALLIRRAALKCEDHRSLALLAAPATLVAITSGSAALALHLYP